MARTTPTTQPSHPQHGTAHSTAAPRPFLSPPSLPIPYLRSLDLLTHTPQPARAPRPPDLFATNLTTNPHALPHYTPNPPTQPHPIIGPQPPRPPRSPLTPPTPPSTPAEPSPRPTSDFSTLPALPALVTCSRTSHAQPSHPCPTLTTPNCFPPTLTPTHTDRSFLIPCPSSKLSPRPNHFLAPGTHRSLTTSPHTPAPPQTSGHMPSAILLSAPPRTSTLPSPSLQPPFSLRQPADFLIPSPLYSTPSFPALITFTSPQVSYTPPSPS